MRGDDDIPKSSYATSPGIANHMCFAKFDPKSLCRIDTGVDTRHRAEQESKSSYETLYWADQAELWKMNGWQKRTD